MSYKYENNLTINGVLKFKGPSIMTPIIESFFSCYIKAILNEDDVLVEEEDVIKFYDSGEILYCNIADAFNENKHKLGVGDLQDKKFSEWIYFLCEKFNVDHRGAAVSWADESNDETLANVDNLFYLSKLFNDGHNLFSMQLEYSDGSNTYLGENVEGYDCDINKVNEIRSLDKDISAGKTQDISHFFWGKIHTLANNIPDETKLLVYQSLISRLQKDQLELESKLQNTLDPSKRSAPKHR